MIDTIGFIEQVYTDREKIARKFMGMCEYFDYGLFEDALSQACMTITKHNFANERGIKSYFWKTLKCRYIDEIKKSMSSKVYGNNTLLDPISATNTFDYMEYGDFVANNASLALSFDTEIALPYYVYTKKFLTVDHQGYEKKFYEGLNHIGLNRIDVTRYGVDKKKTFFLEKCKKKLDYWLNHYKNMDHKSLLEENARLNKAKKISKKNYGQEGTLGQYKSEGLNFIDQGLKNIKENLNLAFLDLRDTKISDAGLAHLKNLANLTDLYLNGTKITSFGLSHLKNLNNLTVLNLGYTQVDEAGLEHLNNLANLTSLDLSFAQISDAGLVHIKNFTNLIILSLAGTQISDAGLAHLKTLTKLTRLDLGWTKISNIGLAYTEHFTELTKLFLNSTQVTKSGIARLKKALPNCKIYSDFDKE